MADQVGIVTDLMTKNIGNWVMMNEIDRALHWPSANHRRVIMHRVRKRIGERGLALRCVYRGGYKAEPLA
jgi:hypothetical protein